MNGVARKKDAGPDKHPDMPMQCIASLFAISWSKDYHTVLDVTHFSFVLLETTRFAKVHFAVEQAFSPALTNNTSPFSAAMDTLLCATCLPCSACVGRGHIVFLDGRGKITEGTIGQLCRFTQIWLAKSHCVSMGSDYFLRQCPRSRTTSDLKPRPIAINRFPHY